MGHRIVPSMDCPNWSLIYHWRWDGERSNQGEMGNVLGKKSEVLVWTAPKLTIQL